MRRKGLSRVFARRAMPGARVQRVAKTGGAQRARTKIDAPRTRGKKQARNKTRAPAGRVVSHGANGRLRHSAGHLFAAALFHAGTGCSSPNFLHDIKAGPCGSATDPAFISCAGRDSPAPWRNARRAYSPPAGRVVSHGANGRLRHSAGHLFAAALFHAGTGCSSPNFLHDIKAGPCGSATDPAFISCAGRDSPAPWRNARRAYPPPAGRVVSHGANGRLRHSAGHLFAAALFHAGTGCSSPDFLHDIKAGPCGSATDPAFISCAGRDSNPRPSDS